VTKSVLVHQTHISSYDLVFTTGNWNQWQTIRVAANDDVIVEDVDFLNFPPQPSNLARLQCLITLYGVGSPNVPEIGDPLLFPGETNADVFVPPEGAEIDDTSK
jgi:hypothetical protein